MPSPDAPDAPTVLTKNRSGWIWTVLVAVVGVLAAVDCLRRGFGAMGLSVLLWTALVCWFIALLFILPRLSIDAAGVLVRNVLVTVRIPWARLEAARSTLFLELVADGVKDVKVWAAPVTAISRGRRAVKERMRSADEEDAPRDDLAAGLIQERERELAAGHGTTGSVVVTPLGRDWGICGGLLLLAVASLVLV